MLPNNRRQAVAIAALKRGRLLASHVWRQDHNGFTHHDPGLIDLVMNKKAEIVRVYLPPDANYPNHSPASWEGDVGARGRWRAYNYDQLIARDKASLDIFWLKDESLEDSDNLPAPEVWRPAPSSCSALSKEQTQPRIR